MPPISVLLYPSQPRCATAGDACRMRNRCARAMAPAAEHKLVDYASRSGGNTALCEGYFDLAQAREEAGRQHAEAIKSRLRGSAS